MKLLRGWFTNFCLFRQAQHIKLRVIYGNFSKTPDQGAQSALRPRARSSMKIGRIEDVTLIRPTRPAERESVAVSHGKVLAVVAFQWRCARVSNSTQQCN